MLSFSVLHFIILISGSKSVKFAQKFRIFLKFLTLEGTLLTSPTPQTHFSTPPLIPIPKFPLPPPTPQHIFLLSPHLPSPSQSAVSLIME